MFFFSFPSKKQFAAGSKKARVFLLNYFVTNFVFCNGFPFSCRGKCRITRKKYQEFDFPPMAPTSNVLASLNCFFIGSHEKNHRKVVARAERKVFGKMPLIVCLLSAATQWALL